MKKTNQFLKIGVFVVLVVSCLVPGLVSAERGTTELSGGDRMAWSWQVDEGGRITWDINSSPDDVQLYIVTGANLAKARNIQSFNYKLKIGNVIQHKGDYKVPFTDTWGLLLINRNFKTVWVTYDVDAHNPSAIPSFTILPVLLSLGVLSTIVHRKRQP